MNPSYNNSFGQQGAISSGQIGGQPAAAPQMPISSGGGDIVLQPEKKSKKGLAIVLAVLMVVVIGVAVVFAIGGFSNKNSGSDNDQFSTFLDEHKDGVLVASTIAEDVLDGKMALNGFMLSKDDYTSQIETLDTAISDLNAIEEKLQKGPEITKRKDGTSLKEDYNNFKNQFLGDKQSYIALVEVTKRIYEVFQGLGTISAEEYLSEYNGMSGVANVIDEFLLSRKNILGSNCGEEDVSAECSVLITNYETAMVGLADTAMLKQAYQSVAPNLKYNGEGSMIEYFNIIYAALGEENEE